MFDAPLANDMKLDTVMIAITSYIISCQENVMFIHEIIHL